MPDNGSARSAPGRLSRGRRRPKVGYVLKRFPRLSETFILNEILELERRGVPIEIFSLLEPAEEVRHEALNRVQAPLTYLAQDRFLKTWQIREEHLADRTFRERPFAMLFPGEEVLEDAVLALKAAALSAVARLRGVEHLHAHFATAATTVAMLAGRLTNIPYSFTAHAKDIYHEYVNTTLLREKIRGARFVITVSEYNRRHLLELAGENLSPKIFKVYNGIDLNRFQPDPSTHPEPDLILGVGRLVEKKGFHHLVQACRLLKDWECPFRCLIVGKGPEEASLARQISKLGLQDRVTLMGAQPQMQLLQTLRRATVLVLPCVVAATGDRDGLPTVLLEALAVGLPAISTTLGGIMEIIEHGKSGLLVPPGDPMRLANAIEEVLANPQLRERLGWQGRSKAEKAFDIRKNALVIRDLFARSAIAQGSPVEAQLDEDCVPLRR